MRFQPTLLLFAAATIHAASLSPIEAMDDPASSPSLFYSLFPELQSTQEMIDYMGALTVFAAKTPASMLSQSHRYLFERVFADKQCAANRNLPQPSLAAAEDDAYRYARYSAAAYCITRSVLVNWNCLGHCTHPSTAGTSNISVREDFATGVKFFTAINADKREIIVSFRGTLTPAALLVDAAFAQASYDGHPDAPKGAKVHAGFQIAYKRVVKLVRDHVSEFLDTHKSLMDKGYTVHVTGHSMGGAMAVFAVLDLAASKILKPSQISLYTYGQPRTGNLEFATFVSSLKWRHLTRITSNSDLIPHVPPTFLDYSHHRSEVYLQGWWFAKDEQGIIMRLKGALRDILGFGRTVSVCKDQFCESDQCADSRPTLTLNLLHHLRYWDITYGPWC